MQANVGEVLVWRNLFWGLSEAMVRNPKPWIGDYLLPDIEPAGAYQIISTMAYTKVKYIIEQTVASGLIYLNSSARDFKNPEIRPYLDKYMRGSNGYSRRRPREADEAAVGRDRHRIRRPPRAVRDQLRRLDRGDPALRAVRGAGDGHRRQAQGLRRACMAEYDLDGWTVPDLTNPGPLSHHAARRQAASGGGGNPQAARSSFFGKGGDYPRLPQPVREQVGRIRASAVLEAGAALRPRLPT